MPKPLTHYEAARELLQEAGRLDHAVSETAARMRAQAQVHALLALHDAYQFAAWQTPDRPVTEPMLEGDDD